MTDNYYHTQESVQEYIQLAKDVNGQELIDELLQHLPQKSSLLEIGSGPGSDWKILNKSYNIVGSDNSKQFLQYLNETNPLGKFLELDAVTLNTNINFDGIYSNKVLHHLTDDQLGQSIMQQHKVLEKNGIICHSFWKGEGSEVFKGLFVKYHNKQSLSKAFDPYFEIILLKDYLEFEEGDSILLIAKKKA